MAEEKQVKKPKAERLEDRTVPSASHVAFSLHPGVLAEDSSTTPKGSFGDPNSATLRVRFFDL